MKEPIQQIDLQVQHRELREDILKAVNGVLDRCDFILGGAVKELEARVAPLFGCAHGVGLNSGTDALVLAMAALGVGRDDEVITTPFTFVATVEMVLEIGARPVMVDVEEDTLNLDPAATEAAITPRTKAIMPVHLYGQPADVTRLRALCERRGIALIEDAAQAVGATHAGKPVGSFGAAGCVSFYPTKNLGACGDAGMVVTNDAKVADAVRLLRAHGSREKYKHVVLGRNSRLDTLQAAILLAKLPHLARWNDARRAHARAYAELLRDLPVRLPVERPENRHVYHQYTIRVDGRRDEVRAKLKEAGIASAVHYPLPLHLQPAFEHLGYRQGACPVSERAAGEVLSLPMYPEMTRAQLERTAAALREALAGAGAATRANPSSL